MPRRMANKQFREDQWAHRYDEHIAPLNRLVDDLLSNDLRNDEAAGPVWAPYVAPLHGGVNARVLTILRDPGPKTQTDTGSGFLCSENDDPTAENLSNLSSGVNLAAGDIVIWNAYPWYINRAPSTDELKKGIEPLHRIIGLMPKLEVVILHGGEAHRIWKYLTKRYPGLVAERKLQVIETYHPSRQAFWHPDEAERERRKQQLQDSYKNAARHLGLLA